MFASFVWFSQQTGSVSLNNINLLVFVIGDELCFLWGMNRGFIYYLEEVSCGGGVEYLHRSLASCRRRRKGNPVPGGYKYGDLALQVRGSLGCERVTCRESCWTRTWEWLRWRGPAAIVNDRHIISWEMMLHKDYSRKCSVGKWNYWS
jgi:hypothetical protein